MNGTIHGYYSGNIFGHYHNSQRSSTSKFDGIKITSSGENHVVDGSCVGGLIGHVSHVSEDNMEFLNIKVLNIKKINASTCAGGVVGELLSINAKFTNIEITNAENITVTNTGAYAAGIVGKNAYGLDIEITFDKCNVTASDSHTNTRLVGLIGELGDISSNNAIITNCTITNIVPMYVGIYNENGANGDKINGTLISDLDEETKSKWVGQAV